MKVFWSSYCESPLGIMLHGGWRLSFDLRHWLFLGERLHRCIIPSCALILPRGFWHPGWIEGELPLGAWRLHPYAAAAAKLLQSCLTLCDPIDGSPPGSPVSGILQARTLEWVAISFSNAWNWKVKVKSLSHVWLCDPVDGSLPGSCVHGIFQARVLEWGAIAFRTKS